MIAFIWNNQYIPLKYKNIFLTSFNTTISSNQRDILQFKEFYIFFFESTYTPSFIKIDGDHLDIIVRGAKK